MDKLSENDRQIYESLALLDAKQRSAILKKLELPRDAQLVSKLIDQFSTRMRELELVKLAFETEDATDAFNWQRFRRLVDSINKYGWDKSVPVDPNDPEVQTQRLMAKLLPPVDQRGERRV